VADVIRFAREFAKPLNRRRRVEIELPEFVVRAIEWRVDEANADAASDETVTFNDVAEWLLATEATLRPLPLIESSIPGFTAAMFFWLMEATYQPEEE
jgi:hypothetical protein